MLPRVARWALLAAIAVIGLALVFLAGRGSRLPRVTEELLRRGYGDQAIRGILGVNLLRVADAVWK
jgi:microsomal dipeptidase-like Zn-dependent dipeptidase